MNELIKAAQELVEKLEIIHSSPEYAGVWQMYANHGLKYNGPTYTEEFEKLKSAIMLSMSSEDNV